MKRYFKLFIGGGLLSLLALQSQAVVNIGNSGGGTGDQHYYIGSYATANPAETSFAFLGGVAPDPGNNDVFEITRQAFEQPGVLTVVDLGQNTDNLSILNMGAGGSVVNTGFVNPNGALNISSPNAALANGVNEFATSVWSGIPVGTHQFQIEVAATLASNGAIGINFNAPVPEPSTGILSMIGLAGLFLRRRR